MSCPKYRVPPGFQLRDGGETGPYDCTAWGASRVIGASTCGRKVPSGRTIRVLTNEPVPDPKSPGLNIAQVADVALDVYGVYLEQRIGGRALPWDEYERRRRNGEPMLIQVSYAPIADSPFDAGRGFRDGHALAETQHSTYDSLADGRAAGVHKHDGRLYPRDLIRQAAGALVLGTLNGKPIRVGDGKVWCAVGRDTAPAFAVTIQPRQGRYRRAFRIFTVEHGRITGYDVRETRGIADVRCDPPRAFAWPSRDRNLRFLVKVREGKYAGRWVRARWAEEVKP